MTSEPLTVDELAPGITSHPNVMSGQPVIKGTRIPASTVAARFFGGKSVVYLAKDHNIRFDQVEAAIRWHLQSHSRQLWLEAAQIADDVYRREWDYAIANQRYELGGRTVALDIGDTFRLKANESGKGAGSSKPVRAYAAPTSLICECEHPLSDHAEIRSKRLGGECMHAEKPCGCGQFRRKSIHLDLDEYQ